MTYGYNMFYAPENKPAIKNLKVSADNRYYLGDCLDDTQVETKHLILRDSTEADIPSLVDVYMSCSYMQTYTGQEHRPEDIRKSLDEGDLPPDGHREFYYTKSVVEKTTGRIVGFLEYYLGYPDENTLWISLLMIHKDMQKEGIGTELMKAFIKTIDRTHLKMVAICVYEKNTPAMKYWKRLGFKVDPAHEVKGGIVKLVHSL